MDDSNSGLHRRAVFLHFVDDELVVRLPGTRRANLEALARLTTILAFAGPEPPIFPLSARHELRDLAALLRNLAPLVDGGYLRLTGAGATPAAYLDARRSQYDAAGRRDEALFDPSEDLIVQGYDSAWIAKRGSTTSAIRAEWGENVRAGAGGLRELIRKQRHAPTDRDVARLYSLPDEIPGQPLIPAVVIEELTRQHLITSQVSQGARDSLTAFLCSEWGCNYADALDAFVLCDLGADLPAMNGFMPLTHRLLSGTRLEAMLKRLELYDPVVQLPLSATVRVWGRIGVARMALAEDLWSRAASLGTPLWSVGERAVLRRFDAEISRSRGTIRRGRASTRQERSELAVARRVSVYAQLCSDVAQTAPQLVVVDRSINIGSISGTAQISTGDDSTLRQASFGNAGVVKALRRALESDDAAEEFVTWLRDAEDRSVDASDLARALATEMGDSVSSDQVKRRATRIAGLLTTSAAGSLLGAGVLAALKLLGL
ncbi:MAG TPA: hypothetical protein VMA83_12465 [Solirubrobacteraceae bacterium]|nr:hypothetical protein [Solirubrobacteraceae bacterium]